jgi:hypothetical protein
VVIGRPGRRGDGGALRSGTEHQVLVDGAQQWTGTLP